MGLEEIKNKEKASFGRYVRMRGKIHKVVGRVIDNPLAKVAIKVTCKVPGPVTDLAAKGLETSGQTLEDWGDKLEEGAIQRTEEQRDRPKPPEIKP